MKGQDSVFSLIKNTKLSSELLTQFNNGADKSEDLYTLGGILSNTKYAWLSSGSKLVVIDLSISQRFAAWNFGATLSNCQTKITCVAELPTPLIEGTIQLAVGLECEFTGGMICIFHCNGSRVLRCIQTESIVTWLAIVDNVPDGFLTCFNGIILAGNQNGEILAIDLNRNECIEAANYPIRGDFTDIKDELNMARVSILSLEDISLIEQQNVYSSNTGDHIAVQFNEMSFVGNKFIFHNPDSTVRLRADKESVYVSTLLYIPQLASIIVGFNFGAFQIWNLITLSLEYTSPVHKDCVPVTHLGFQEPSDDPRAFCYLWVVYSGIDRTDPKGFPLAVMYSLTYQGKRIISDTVCLYEDFASCSVRFDLEMKSNDSITSYTGGQALAAHTFSINSNNTSNTGDESILNICHLVWECWTNLPNGPVQYLMLVFDLDQWYKDHMPALSNIETNTYMSVVNIGDAIGNVESPLCDVRVDCSTLSQYSSVQRLEEHFYPNSLAYDCLCLTATDLAHISTKGLQRQIITNLHKIGPIVLLNPTKLYFQCVNAGLTPLYSDVATNKADIAAQREYILSIALESKLLPFLTKCISDWATGSHSSTGCTHQFFVDWCWNRAITLKKNGRELTTLLFNHSGVMPDRNTCKCLDLCVRQLSNISVLLENATTKCANSLTPDALHNINERHKCIQMVAMYFQVIQWFLNVGLLPEFSIDQDVHMMEGENQHLPYPVESLVRFYQKRRYKLNCLNGEKSSDQDLQNKSCPLLFIDQLIENECHGEQIHNLWQTGGSTCGGVYPPPSLYALLKIYLLPNIKEEYKHSLVLYLLVDYSMMFDDIRYEGVIRRLMQFPTMFGLSNTEIKATQAFWHLDHRDFDFALDQLQCLTGNSIPEWQHRVVLSALLAQKKTQAALQYTTVRQPLATIKDNTDSKFEEMAVKLQRGLSEDWQASCSLFLARGLIFQAFEVIRATVKNVFQKEEKLFRLNFLFEGCKNMGLISRLLKVPMSIFEENAFVKFLEGCNDKQSKDILVVFYLQNSRFLEAQRFNEAIKPKKSTAWHKMSKLTDTHPEKTDKSDRQETRDLIVDLFCSSLPKITTQLAKCLETNIEIDTKIVDPKPMSVFVQAKSGKPQTYKSSFIQGTIEKASEIWIKRPKLSEGLKRALNIEETPFVCTPKLSRTSRRVQVDTSKSNIANMSVDSELSPTPNKRPRLSSMSLSDQHDNSREQLSIDDIKNKSVLSQKLVTDMENLLHIPPIERTVLWKTAIDTGSSRSRSVREATPQSILKVRRLLDRSNASPVDSKYLADSDEELETASHYTYQSDNASKCLRFDIPNSEHSTPSPDQDNIDTAQPIIEPIDIISKISEVVETETPENPRKKFASEISMSTERSYKDKVRGRRTSHNSSSSLNNSTRDEVFFTENESIADIPETIINVTDKRDSGTAHRSAVQGDIDQDILLMDKEIMDKSDAKFNPNVSEESIRKGPTPRRSIRSNIPDVASIERRRSLRSRSRTPEVEVKSRTSESPKKVQALIEKGSKGRKALSRVVLEANTCNRLVDTSSSSGATESFSPIETTPNKKISGRLSLLKSRSESLASSTPKHKISSNIDNPILEISGSLIPEDTVDMDTTFEETGVVRDEISLNVTSLSWLNKSVLRDFDSSTENNPNPVEIHKAESIVENKSIVTKTMDNVTVNSSMGITDSYLLCNKSVLADYDTSTCEITPSDLNPIETDDIKSKPVRKSVVTETVHSVTVNSSLDISDSYIKSLVTNKSVLHEVDSILIDKMNEPEISSDQSVSLNPEVSIIVPEDVSPNKSVLKDEFESFVETHSQKLVEKVNDEHDDLAVEEVISIEDNQVKELEIPTESVADKVELVSKDADEITSTPALEERKRIVEIEKEIDEIEDEFEVSDDESENQNLVIDNDSDEVEDVEVLEDEDYDSGSNIDEEESVVEEGEQEQETETDTSVDSAANLEEDEESIADVISLLGSSSNEDNSSEDDKPIMTSAEVEQALESKPASSESEIILVQEDDDANEDTNDNSMNAAKDRDPFLKPISETSDESVVQLKASEVSETSKEVVSQADFNYSLMTDDNSILQSDQSEMRLSYNEESTDAELKNSQANQQDIISAVSSQVKNDVIEVEAKSEDCMDVDVAAPVTGNAALINSPTEEKMETEDDDGNFKIKGNTEKVEIKERLEITETDLTEKQKNVDPKVKAPKINDSDKIKSGTEKTRSTSKLTSSELSEKETTVSEPKEKSEFLAVIPRKRTKSIDVVSQDRHKSIGLPEKHESMDSKLKDPKNADFNKSETTTEEKLQTSKPISSKLSQNKTIDSEPEKKSVTVTSGETVKSIDVIPQEKSENIDSNVKEAGSADSEESKIVLGEKIEISKPTSSELSGKSTTGSEVKKISETVTIISRKRAKSVDVIPEEKSKMINLTGEQIIIDSKVEVPKCSSADEIRSAIEKTIDTSKPSKLSRKTSIDSENSEPDKIISRKRAKSIDVVPLEKSKTIVKEKLVTFVSHSVIEAQDADKTRQLSKDSEALPEAQTEEMETEPSTTQEKEASTRKRTLSVSSTKSNTSIRSRTRRSKSIEAISDIKETEEVPAPEVETVKPARRTRRNTRSTEEPDNISVASSATSKRSVQSRAETSSVEDKPAPVPRKPRRSMLSLKRSDLSVIPEISSEEISTSKVDHGTSQMAEEYSTTRRLTRKQRSLLEKSLETPLPKPALIRKSRRPSAISSTASHADSEYSFQLDDDKASSSEFASVKSIDPITLLDKDDFVGPPDEDEHLETASIISKASSIASDFTKQKKTKSTRSGSVAKESGLTMDTRRTPETGRPSKPASESGYIGDLKKSRRSSINLDKTQTPDARVSPGSVDSPSRGIRRTSFNKAVEALHTPKRGRRTSSDIRSDADSMPGTPVGASPDLDRGATEERTELAVTPRRTRRTPSVASETSETPVGRRTRRATSVASEDADEKKDKSKTKKK